MEDMNIILEVYFEPHLMNYYIEHFSWNVLRSMPQNTFEYYKSTLEQLMDWCRHSGSVIKANEFDERMQLNIHINFRWRYMY